MARGRDPSLGWISILFILLGLYLIEPRYHFRRAESELASLGFKKH